MAKERTPEEIAEENDRTNEVGLFNFADAYLLCAKQLIDNRLRELRFDDSIQFLLFHAAELYLKSYLRQKGEDVAALKRLGHSHVEMCKKVATFGLNLRPDVYDIFELVDRKVIESRYIVTGYKKRIENRALSCSG